MYARFWWGNLREGNNLEDPGVDWRIIIKCVFKKWDGDMDWIALAQDRDGRRELVNVTMKLRVL